MTLSDKTALVTGGGSGIGLAIAESLAREGCRVAIAGRNPERLAEAVAGYSGPGRLASHTVDVADRGAVLDSLDQVTEQPGRSQRGQRGTHVERDRTPEQAGVPAGDRGGVATYGPAVGDRQHGVHRSAPSLWSVVSRSTPRVTTAR